MHLKNDLKKKKEFHLPENIENGGDRRAVKSLFLCLFCFLEKVPQQLSLTIKLRDKISAQQNLRLWVSELKRAGEAVKEKMKRAGEAVNEK